MKRTILTAVIAAAFGSISIFGGAYVYGWMLGKADAAEKNAQIDEANRQLPSIHATKTVGEPSSLLR